MSFYYWTLIPIYLSEDGFVTSGEMFWELFETKEDWDEEED